MGGVDFVNGVGEGDTPPIWYAVFKGLLDGTQYAKGQYAGRKNPVISYADINFYFKKVQFSSINTTNVVVISAFINLNIDFGRSKTRNSKKTHQS